MIGILYSETFELQLSVIEDKNDRYLCNEYIITNHNETVRNPFKRTIFISIKLSFLEILDSILVNDTG